MHESELGAAVSALYDAWMSTVDAAGPTQARLGLTPAQSLTLWVIDPDEPAPSMKVMAERLHCNAPNLSFMANQLVERGLVERAVDPADRRSRVLRLTAQGRLVREEVNGAALARTPLVTLDADELGQLVTLLRRALGGRADGSTGNPP